MSFFSICGTTWGVNPPSLRDKGSLGRWKCWDLRDMDSCLDQPFEESSRKSWSACRPNYSTYPNSLFLNNMNYLKEKWIRRKSIKGELWGERQEWRIQKVKKKIKSGFTFHSMSWKLLNVHKERHLQHSCGSQRCESPHGFMEILCINSGLWGDSPLKVIALRLDSCTFRFSSLTFGDVHIIQINSCGHQSKKRKETKAVEHERHY